MSDQETWTCPSCAVAVATPYCPRCGERPVLPRELSLRGLVHQAVQAFTSLDDRVLRTVRCLVFEPGRLTLHYVHGPRKPYIGPFALFLLANVVFVAMESLAKSFIFSPALANQLQNQPWSPLARDLVARRLADTTQTLATYAQVFDPAVATNAKSLVVLMVPPFALLLPLVFRGSHRPFVANVAFSLHFHAFLLLLFSVALVVPAIDLFFGGVGLASQRLDDSLSLALLVSAAVYLYFAIGPVYGPRGATRLAKAALLAVLTATIVLGYRFAVFLITLWQTTF